MREQRIQFLEKYASLAEDLLISEYGQEYTAADVEKLAAFLIEADIKRAEEVETIENLQKEAQHLANGFFTEMNTLTGGQFDKYAVDKLKVVEKLTGAFEKVKGKATELYDKAKLTAGKAKETAGKVKGQIKEDPAYAAGLGGAGVLVGAGGTALLSD